MSSVMTPVNVWCAGAADNAATKRTLRTNLMGTSTPNYQLPTPKKELRTLGLGRWELGVDGFFLEARNHQMRGRRARVHDPHAALLPVVRKAGRLRRRTGNGNRRVATDVVLVHSHHVVPHRAVLWLDARTVFLSRSERRRPLRAIGLGFELQVLRHARQIREAGALGRERLLTGLPRSIEAHHVVRPLAHGVVGVVRLPLDDGRAVLQLWRRRSQRGLEICRRLRERSGRYGERPEKKHDTFHDCDLQPRSVLTMR